MIPVPLQMGPNGMSHLVTSLLQNLISGKSSILPFSSPFGHPVLDVLVHDGLGAPRGDQERHEIPRRHAIKDHLEDVGVAAVQEGTTHVIRGRKNRGQAAAGSRWELGSVVCVFSLALCSLNISKSKT